MSPAVRQADHTRPDAVSHLDRRRHPAHTGADLSRPTIGQPQRLSIVRVHVQGAAWPPLHQHLDVVHPRVVTPEIPTTNEHHPALLELGLCCSQAIEVGNEHLGGEFDLAARGPQNLGETRLQCTEIATVRPFDEIV